MSCFEKVDSIAGKFDAIKRLDAVAAVFAIDLVCAIICGFPFSDNSTIGNPFFRNSIAMSVCHFCMGIIIASWVYSAPRVTQWDKDIEGILYDLTGEVKCKSSDGKSDNKDDADYSPEAGKLYAEQKRLAITWPVKKKTKASAATKDEDSEMTKEEDSASMTDGAFARTVKIAYIAVWIGIVIFLSCLILPLGLGHIKLSFFWRAGWQAAAVCIQGLMTWVIGVACMLLCMHSWWYSMEYGYFLSRIANTEAIKNFNKLHPSQTRALKRLLHASTMLSVAFLVTSALLALQYAVVIGLDGLSAGTRILDFLWMLLIVIPGVCSLIPVVVLPKLFIVKIHRKWKMQLIKEYEAQLLKTRSERKKWDILEKISTIDKDKLDFHYFEVIGAVITVILHFGMLLATIMIS